MKFVTGSMAQALFDHGAVRAVFEHARNLLVATIIVAAGFETVRNFDTIDLPGLPNPLLAGYVVAGAGCALTALNFIDGLQKLARLRWHVALQIALSIAYLLFSLRVVQLMIFFRTHAC